MKINSINKIIEREIAIKNGFVPNYTSDFEPVMYASNSTGLKYFDGWFLQSEVANASPKFKTTLRNYQSLVLNTNTYLEGPTLKMYFRYKNLLKLAKKENIKYFTNKEKKDFVDNFKVKEELRLNEWLAHHPAIKLEATKNYKNMQNPENILKDQPVETSEIDNVYNDIMKNTETENEK